MYVAVMLMSTKLSAVAEASENMDQRIGMEIIQKALRAPLSTIAANAGEEGAVVCGELMKEDTPVETGFDAQNGLYCNMHEASIIDPTKVTRTGLVSATNVC